MRIEKFTQLKIGDKIKSETYMGIKTGKICEINSPQDPPFVLCKSEHDVIFYSTPRQCISKIVKRKKPELIKIGYAIYRKEMTEKKYAYRTMKIATLGDVSPQRESEDTHEVYVRPIVGKK